MWAAAMGYLGDKGSTVGWYSFYMFVWSNGAAFYDTVCIGTNVRNFPNDRGRVTGLLKAFMGLSASIVTIFFTSVFKDDKTLFILFLGALTGGLGLLACFATSLVPTRKAVAISQRDSKWLNAGMLCLAILMIYVLTIAIVETTNPELGGALWTSMAMLPLIALQAVVMVPACLDSKWYDDAVYLFWEGFLSFSSFFFSFYVYLMDSAWRLVYFTSMLENVQRLLNIAGFLPSCSECACSLAYLLLHTITMPSN